MTTLLHRSPPRRISLLDFRTATARDAGTEQPKQPRPCWSKSCKLDSCTRQMASPLAARDEAGRFRNESRPHSVRLTVVGGQLERRTSRAACRGRVKRHA